MALTPGQINTYWKARDKGASIPDASLKAGFSESTGHRLEKKAKIKPEWSPAKEAGTGKAGQPGVRERKLVTATLPGPIPLDQLCPEAKRALEDFDYFRRRYWGRISPPWMLEAIDILMELLVTENREFVDLNEAPGVGKSTLLSDFKCWLICRDRTVRMLTGSATQSLARRQLMRVRRSLERTVPLKGDPKLVALGLALDAESTLIKDFGRFEPLNREAWNQDAFIVMQHGAIGIEDKEATLTAYGIDTEFTGGRFNYVEWDDLISPKEVGSPGYRENLEKIYVQTCEPRVEPEGLMVLSGQRLASDDLHRFALDMVMPPDDDDEDDDAPLLTDDEQLLAREALEDRKDMKYKHIVYKAHYVDRCLGTKECHNKKTAKYYPEGCLLDPYRLPYRDLAAAMENTPGEFALVYQQEDADPDKALAKREWIYGDDRYVGCVDYDRGLWELPDDLSAADCVVYATADPSPSMYWSIQCWVYHDMTKRRILLDHVRTKMRANELLDRPGGRKFTGIMEVWQRKSEQIGFPIGTWVIEANAAQKFMLQYDHVREWRISNGIDIIPHTTGINKVDPNYGVWTMQNLYRLGRVRLPMKGEARLASLKLIEEVIVYDHGRTDDCVMAQWMGEWKLPDLTLPMDDNYVPDTPQWVLEQAF